MKALLAFWQKECMEITRTGKLIILLLIFVLFGIMNPAVAKLTPWMLEMLSEQLAESGFAVLDVTVDAMTSWTQFYKNIPLALIAYVLIFSDSFTGEYRSGTLLLALTKGLPGYKVVLAKTTMLLALWTLGYGLCFSITWGYNAYFWDNGIAEHLLQSAVLWWLFGVWVICLLVLFSALLQNNTGVVLCTGGTVLLLYVLSAIPKVKAYLPVLLMNSGSLLSGAAETDAYGRAALAAVASVVVSVTAGILIMNKKQM